VDKKECVEVLKIIGWCLYHTSDCNCEKCKALQFAITHLQEQPLKEIDFCTCGCVSCVNVCVVCHKPIKPREQPREDKLRLPTAICPKCNQFAFRIYKDHLEDNSHQCCNCQFIFKPQPPQSKLKERKIHEWEVSDEYGWRMVELWERDGQLELFATDKKGGNVESRV